MLHGAIDQQPLYAQLDVALIVLWAMGLGGVIGLERERASKALGIRTHMLVAGVAALVVTISAELVSADGGDPSRGIHGVITGIGFLGAGAIIQSKKGYVTGLTSAASILYTAGVGSAVASGYGITATACTLIALVVLYGIGYISHRYSRNQHGDPTTTVPKNGKRDIKNETRNKGRDDAERPTGRRRDDQLGEDEQALED